MARSVALTLTLIGGGAAAHAAAAADNGLPAERFAPDVAALAAQGGWRVAEVTVTANIDDSGDMTLAITLAKGSDAQRFSLAFEDWGQALVDYHHTAVPVPSEVRVYEQEADLIALLGAGTATKLYEECGGYYLRVGTEDAPINEYAYHVVEKHVRGAGAGKALAAELSGALNAGMKLVDVTESDDDQPHVIQFTLADADQKLIRAELDKKGNVVAVEVERSPVGGAWQTIHTPGLVKALVKGREVKTLRWQDSDGDDGPGRVVGTMKSGKKFVIDLADAEHEEYSEGDCGC